MGYFIKLVMFKELFIGAVMKTREIICKELNKFLFEQNGVLAVWEGGSVATGFADNYSDLDLVIVVNDEFVEETFKCIDDFIDKTYQILRKYRVPEPTWHGFSQTFYQANDVPDLFYFDISVVKKSTEDKFLENSRHGFAKVWFEKEKFVKPVESKQSEIDQRVKKYFEIATASDFITIIEIKKKIKRRLFSEAFPFYFNFIARNLGILLNIVHRPHKVDFGLRYIYRDYPQSDHKLIEEALQVNNIEELEVKFTNLLVRYEELKSQIENTLTK